MSQANTGRGNWRGGGGGWRGQGRGGWRGRGGGWRGRGGGWRGRGGGRGGWQGKGRGSGNNDNPTPSISQQPRMVQLAITDVPSPYSGWKLYFPQEAYSDHSPIVQRTQMFEKYFVSWKSSLKIDDIESKGCYVIDYKEFIQDQIISDMPDFSKELKSMPETIISCMGLALHQVLSSEKEADDEGLTQFSRAHHPNLGKIHCRLKNYEPVTHLKNLKANYYGKFVSIKGTVVRVSNIKPLCTRLAFECSSCAAVLAVLLPDGKYTMPSKCSNTECKGQTFLPKRGHQLTETIDWQTIRLQEIINDDQRESGRIPRTVDCELTHDLVDSCVPGDQISLSGCVKVQATDEGRGKQKDKCMFLLYVHANSVTNSKGQKNCHSATTPSTGIEFTMKELYAIEEIQAEKNLLKLLVGSLCPSIYGHEMVKAGLILGLFGGSTKYVNDKNRIPVRGDPHVLVVGDPGLGKSQLLAAAAHVSPRSVYVCGNTSSTAGLTVTLTREAGTGDYALEAGALVLADQGCCCIDEFDKMSSQHSALLEAMEQQSISIAKAGIVCSLPSRTSILAAANPVGGHYNKGKTVSENLRMGSALLSRFDLVFILLDKPDEELDSMLSEHVMAMHAGGKLRANSTMANTTQQTQEEADARRVWESQQPLSRRLKVSRTEPFDPLPPQLLRKYITYARKYVHPKITPEAADVLQAFYLDLRGQHQGQDSTPITTRQLESMIRLTEARARLELSEQCTQYHARDVVDIMKYSMFDTFTNEYGVLDFNRSQHGSGMSSKSQAKKFVSVLQRVSQQNYNTLFTVQEMRQLAKDAQIKIRDFDTFISSLNDQGYILKKGPRTYQLQVTDY